MLDALKKLAIMGVGAISMAEDEAKNVVSELRHKGELSEEEGRKVLTEWKERVALNKQELEETAKKAAAEALKDLGVPTREEYDALVARVAELESQLGEGHS